MAGKRKRERKLEISSFSWPSDIPHPPDPRLELERLRSIGNLRKLFDSMCRKVTETSTRFSFERWLYRSLSLATVECPSYKSMVADPIIPSWKWLDSGLVSDLIRMLDFPEPEATNIALELASKASSEAARICELNFESPTPELSYIPKMGDILEIMLPGDRHPQITITKLHFNKLVELFIGAFKLQSTADEVGSSSIFKRLVFCVLVRYKAFGGDGYQAALPKDCFQMLQKSLKVSHECFASPFNAHLYDSYCSAFPDLDFYFGSKGSFFDYDISTGSYEVNPPFAAELILAAVEKVERAMSSSENPLSFVIVVPAWEETFGWQKLESSRYLKCHVRFEGRKHSYIDGAAFKKSADLRVAPFDTSVFVLQNDKGEKEWPFTDETKVAIRRTFQIKSWRVPRK